MISRSAFRLAAIPLALLVLANPAPALATEVRAEPGAELWSKVVAAYRGLTNYADEGRLVAGFRRGDRTIERGTMFRVALERPERVAIETAEFRLFRDAGRLVLEQPTYGRHQILRVEAPLDYRELINRAPTLRALLDGAVDGRAVALVLRLLLDPNAEASLGAGARFEVGEDAPVGETLCRTLLVEPEEGTPLRLFVDPETSLVRRIELVGGPKNPILAELVKDAVVGWNSGPILTRLADIPESRFAFRPGPDQRPITGLRGAEKFLEDPLGALLGFDPPRDPKREAERAMLEPREVEYAFVGEPAPETSLRFVEADGSFREAPLSEFAGKVVVLDFWTTWSGPSVRSLAAFQKLIEKYADSDRAADVVFLAISADAEPEEPEGVRDLVRKTLADNGIRVDHKPGARLAIDPELEAVQDFDVSDYPAVLILDKASVIRWAKVGFVDDLAEILAPEIDKLLDEKPGDRPAPAPKGEEEADPAPDPDFGAAAADPDGR